MATTLVPPQNTAKLQTTALPHQSSYTALTRRVSTGWDTLKTRKGVERLKEVSKCIHESSQKTPLGNRSGLTFI